MPDRIPPQRRDGTLLALLVLTSVVVQCLLMNTVVQIYDEGLRLYAGAGVAEGYVPYRDFWGMYGPATDYLLGGAFRLFGESVLVARTIDLALRTLVVVLCYVIGRRFGSRTVAAGCAFFSLCALTAAATYETPAFPATGCALLAVYAAWLSLTGPKPVRAALLGGLATGLACALRTDMGAYTFAAVVVGFAVHLRGSRDARGAWRRSIVPFVAATSVVVGAVALFLVVEVPLHDLYDDFVRIPFTVYKAYRAVPFPLAGAIDSGQVGPMRNYLVYLPFVVAAWVAASWSARRAPPPVPAGTGTLYAMLVALSLLFVLKGIVRVELAHMTPAIIVASIVCVPLIEHHARGLARSLAIALLALVAIKLAIPPDDRLRPLDRLGSVAAFVAHGTLPDSCESPDVARMRCFRVAGDLHDALRYVDAHTSANDPIFVAAGRHDRLFLNNVEFYFLAGRRAPTRWHDLHPGVQTTEPIQREMIADFERRPPKLVIVNYLFDRANEPNRSSESSGVVLLDRWLAARYRPVFTRGDIAVLAPVPIATTAMRD